MHILRLVRSAPEGIPTGTVLVTFLAGLGNVALIGMVNDAAERAAMAEPIEPVLVLGYLGILAFFYAANRLSLREANRFVQERLDRLRLRVVDKIRRAPLRSLETIGHGDLFAAVAQETNHLSQNLPLFVSAVQSGVLLGFCLLYIAALSPVSFLLVGAITLLGLYAFWRGRLALNRSLAGVYVHEAAMLDGMTGFIKGFQETRLNAARNEALFRRFGQTVDELERAVVGVGGQWVTLLQFTNAFLYALIGVVIFVLPIFFSGYTDVIYKIAAAAIFCVGPVIAITSATHLYARAEIGLGHVYQIEGLLDRDAAARAPPPERSRFRGFREIAFRNLSFTYRDAAGQPVFDFGPLDLTVRRGETLFLVGGNGAGKSTAMKLISGLYAPDAGMVSVDGVPVAAEAAQEYRELFSAIFADFHLFDRLHGLRDLEEARVVALLRRMELEDKVSYAEGRFSTTALSTGQRKRLAMIAALLEEREVCIFDEWAADQDPHFRDVFYTELLPELRRRGVTVLAVTHDDRYWDRCDRRIRLDLGRVVAEEPGGVPAPRG